MLNYAVRPFEQPSHLQRERQLREQAAHPQCGAGQGGRQEDLATLSHSARAADAGVSAVGLAQDALHVRDAELQYLPQVQVLDLQKLQPRPEEVNDEAMAVFAL